MQQNSLPKNELKKEYGAYIYAGAILVFICIQLAVYVAAIFIWRGEPDEPLTPPPEFLLFASFLLQVGFAALYFLFYRKHRVKPDHSLKTKLNPKWYALSAILGVACLFLFMSVHILFANFLENRTSFTSPDSPFADPSGFIQIFLIILTAVIAAPIGEELIFRGGLIDGLNKKFPVFATAALSGILFSFMHMNPASTVYQFFLGFAAACLVLATKSIIPAVILHAVSNLIVALSILINPVYSFFNLYTQRLTSGWGIVLSILLAFIGVSVFAGLVVISNKKRKIHTYYTPQDKSIIQEKQAAENVLSSPSPSLDNVSPYNKSSKLFYACLIAPFLITLLVWLAHF